MFLDGCLGVMKPFRGRNGVICVFDLYLFGQAMFWGSFWRGRRGTKSREVRCDLLNFIDARVFAAVSGKKL